MQWSWNGKLFGTIETLAKINVLRKREGANSGNKITKQLFGHDRMFKCGWKVKKECARKGSPWREEVFDVIVEEHTGNVWPTRDKLSEEGIVNRMWDLSREGGCEEAKESQDKVKRASSGWKTYARIGRHRRSYCWVGERGFNWGQGGEWGKK